MGDADHFDLLVIGDPHALDVLAVNVGIGAHRREILHAREAELLYLLEKDVHIAKGIVGKNPCQHRRLFYHRKHDPAQLEHDTVCIPQREIAAD